MQYPSTSFVIFIIPVLISTVNSQAQTQPIVNVKTIQDTKPFTITCDVNRVDIPAEDANVDNIFTLKVAINTTAHPSTTVAEYHPTLDALNREYKNVPIGRTWDVVFSGGNVTSNRKTIKIEILVKDAKCTDAGLYSCSVQYYKSGLTSTPSTTQNVTAEAAILEPVLKLEPLNVGPSGLANYSRYNLNDSVTLTCRVDGPQNLAIKWRRERKPALGSGDIYQDYPYDSDIKDEATTQTGTGACSQFHYLSKLSFFTTEDDKQRLYMCAVQVDGVDFLTISATVDLMIVPPSPNPQTANAGADKGSIGLIVGVVLGSIAVIIIVAIIIGVVCYRRRAKKNNNKDATDTPYGGATEPTYPTVASRTHDYNQGRGREAHDVSARRDKQPSDVISYKKREGRPQDHTLNSDDNYNHQQKPVGRYRNHGGRPVDTQYTSADVAHSEDETAVQLVAPPVKEKPKPAPKPATKPKPQIPKREEDDDRPLQYAQLDLHPSRNEGPENTGRRKTNMPIEYAEISV